jgi:hypothetical protein
MPGGTIAVASDDAGFDLKEFLKRDPQAAGLDAPDPGVKRKALKKPFSVPFEGGRQARPATKLCKVCTS